MNKANFLIEIRKLFLASFNRDISIEFLTWRYKNNPSDDFLFSTHKEEDNLLASYSVSPSQVSIGKKTFSAALSMTTMTHPSARGKGLFPNLASKLFRRMEKKGYALILAFANAQSHNVFIKKLSFKDLYEIPTMNLEFKNVRLNSLEVEKNIIKDDSLDLDYSHLKKQSLFSIKKDFVSLKWRYIDNPENEYHIYSIVNGLGKRVSSTVICKIYNDSLDIVDMQFKDQSEGLEILKFIIKKYSSDDVYKFNVWCPIHHFMHEVLERVGFVNSSPVTYLIVKKLKKNILAKGWDDFRNWYIQMGDSDLY